VKLARFFRVLTLENHNIGTAGKVFAIGADEQCPQRMLPGLAHSRSKVFD
jgi:hypothetical protein